MPLSGRAAFSNCRSPHPWHENKPAARHSPLPINRSPQLDQQGLYVTYTLLYSVSGKFSVADLAVKCAELSVA